jgi:hypothetical protein
MTRRPRHPARRFKRFLQEHPAEGFWVKTGLVPAAAKGLVRAGILDLESLARVSRQDFLAIHGAGEGSLAQCEALLGRPLPSSKSFWQQHGLALITVHALQRAGIDSLEKLAAQTRESFLATEGLGNVALRACEAILGRKLDSPVRDWQGQGLSGAGARALARARIRSLAELAAKPLWFLHAIGLKEADVAVCKRLLRQTATCSWA